MPFIAGKDKDGYEFVRWEGTEEEFEEWKRVWKSFVPGCHEFKCVHELMSCGIDVMCGDCSVYSTAERGASRICTEVGCQDCIKHGRCKKEHDR